MLQAKAWRLSRHHSSPAAKMGFAEFCLYVDRLNAEDREAGRPSAVKVLDARYRSQGLNPDTWAVSQEKVRRGRAKSVQIVPVIDTP